MSDIKRILITGADGFIGKNLKVKLKEICNFNLFTFVRGDNLNDLYRLVSNVDVVVHLAGVNRPSDISEFESANVGITAVLCEAVQRKFEVTGNLTPLLLASSIHAMDDSFYGRSKLNAERVVQKLSDKINNPCWIFRLPGVFGKWCKPNYNSVVATFCYNIARGLPIQVNDPDAVLHLAYIDDVVQKLVNVLDKPPVGLSYINLDTTYDVRLGDLVSTLRSFERSRSTLIPGKVGTGLLRALYATYISYLPHDEFSYLLNAHSDPRGMFVEFLKTHDSGQFSYFTALPGVTRGGHYHHTKNEKFLVLSGDALFRFQHVVTKELIEIKVSGGTNEVVDTIPGWAHDITNIGASELVVMLWANENFNRDAPDTVVEKL